VIEEVHSTVRRYRVGLTCIGDATESQTFLAPCRCNAPHTVASGEVNELRVARDSGSHYSANRFVPTPQQFRPALKEMLHSAEFGPRLFSTAGCNSHKIRPRSSAIEVVVSYGHTAAVSLTIRGPCRRALKLRKITTSPVCMNCEIRAR
jgi:hypothetical protein